MPESRVTVVEPPERVAAFERVFGGPTVPVKELLPLPSATSVPAGYQGRQVEKPCYQLDLDKLSFEQLERLIAYSMEQFGMSRAECERELPNGYPILAEGTIFESDSREFL